MSSIELYRPIPELPSVEGWKDVLIEECGEPLVPVGPMSCYAHIAADAIYAGEHTSSPYRDSVAGSLEGALLTPFVRQGVARQLMVAVGLLPVRHMLLVWDPYRPLLVQQALYDWYVEKLVTDGMGIEKARIEAQTFVSLPSRDPTRPSPHNTGGAVDVTILSFPNKEWNPRTSEPPNGLDEWETWCRQVHLVGQPLQMGTAFDAVQSETATRFYEEFRGALTLEQELCRNSRRLLYNVMAAAGFSNYREEWWHFNLGNQMDAVTRGPSATAMYGAIELSQGNTFFEARRQDWNQARLKRHGSPLLSAHPKAAML